MTTGQRIRVRRKSIGLSAEQLAEFLGCAPATIYRYENGDIEKVPGDSLGTIAKALQTTPAFLMGWDEDTTTQSTNFSSLLYNDGVFPHLLKTYETLNADGRQKVYERATELAELPKYQLNHTLDASQFNEHSADEYYMRIGINNDKIPNNYDRSTTVRVASPIILPTPKDSDDENKP